MESKVSLVAYTKLDRAVTETLTDWEPEGDESDAEAIIEFAGRACYESWHKPNPATAHNYGYLKHIIDVGHFSVLEHGVATFYITGISRPIAQELLRHRHLSPSMRSQRFVDETEANYVIPPKMRGETTSEAVLEMAMKRARDSYAFLVEDGLQHGLSRKQAREAARAVLPAMTETRVVLTGNLRSWREIVTKRYDPAADQEIQELAGKLLWELKCYFPAAFQDFPTPARDDWEKQ